MSHNKTSAAHVRKIVELYNSHSGLSEADGPEISLSDMLADIRHFCRQNDIDFGTVLFRANNYYADELAEVG